MIKTIKGFKDIFGLDADIFEELEYLTGEVARNFGYERIIFPTIENSELFNRSVGQETDIVEKEMYTFLDKSGRSITLRPEMTASAARSYIENHFETLPSPLRVYYFGQCFRYENPQKGRFREFFQFGVEAFGDESPLLDAEVIKIAIEILKKLKISKVKVKLNSIGCRDCREKYREALIKAITPHFEELCEDCKRRLHTNPLRILDCKKESDELKAQLPKTIAFLCEKCRNHFETLLEHLTIYDIPFEIDSTLVRGLDYYSRTVFEVISEDLGAQNALLGGGRYDYLIEELGGRPTPGVGFAMGIERLVEVLKKSGYQPEKRQVIYVAYDSKALKYALKISDYLRDAGFKVIIDQKGGSFKSQLMRSSKRNSDFTAIIGENEINNNSVQLKNMKTKEQKEIELKLIPDTVKEWKNA